MSNQNASAQGTQVQLLVEDFENDMFIQFQLNSDTIPAKGDNKWIVNKTYNGSGVYPNTTDQNTTMSGQIGNPNEHYLHIHDSKKPGGAANANFDPTNASETWAILPQGICTMSLVDIRLVFFWLAEGSANSFGEVYYSADYGAWTQIGQTKYNNQGIWKFEEIKDVSFENVEDLRFAFRWVNPGGESQNSMSFAIDDVQIIGTYDPNANPVDIIISDIVAEVCEGTTFNFTFEFTDTLCDGSYLIMLSDDMGSFDNPTSYWSFSYPYPFTTGSFGLTLPTDVYPGDCYKIKINRLSPLPALEGIASVCFKILDCDNTITTKQPPVTFEQGNGDTLCMGSVIDARFQSWGVFNAGNLYMLELSKPDGTFPPPGKPKILGKNPDDKTYNDLFFPPVGSVGGLVPDTIPESCNYYIRVNSSLPGTFGAPWGPFCIKQCDIKTNDKKDIQVCITAEEGACVDVKIDINYFDPNILYDPANNFMVEIRDPMFFSLVNMGGLGIFPGTTNDVVQVCIPKWPDLDALGMKPGMYYMRIVGTNSNDPENLLGTLIHLTIGVKKPTPPSVYATDTVVCTGNTAFFYVTNVDPASTYEWFLNGSSFYHGSAMGVIFNSPPGTVFDVTVQETNYGCKGPMSPPVKVYVTGPPKTVIDGKKVVCAGEVVQYCVPFIPKTYYDWQFTGATLVDTSNSCVTIQFFDDGTGIATLNVKALNACGEAFGTFEVQVNKAPEVTVDSMVVVCTGQSVTLNAIVTGADTYIWTDPLGNEIGVETPSVTFTPPNTGYYSLLAIDWQCQTKKDILVIVNPIPTPTITGLTDACEGETVTLTATGGSSYVWGDGTTGPILNVTLPGTYTVEASNGTGDCKATTEHTVTFHPIPVVDLGGPYEICEGGEVTLDAKNPGATFNWSNGGTDPTIDVTEPGEYTVTVSAWGCETTGTATVSDHPFPIVDLGPDLTVCEDSTVTLTPGETPGAFYGWSTGANTPTIDVVVPKFKDGPLQINVAVTNDCGTRLDSIIINPIYCGEILPCIIVPNAYSPNNDAVNDLFIPKFQCEPLSYYFRIYNRWGEKVFETNDFSQGWDGMFSNSIAPLGVYVWAIEFNRDLPNGTMSHEKHKGNVTLLR
ncbi:MAG: gliding motility-associated C-terminal domain-containing protein [Sphingobacteriales bacterium]|nr:gliding motility-associated C-terminal domain-containing protein [Sphingobacteriales bacterium]MBL0246817.1 gliding motility-associated C-terminal domain-containing protein [Sphingobacteriales bacterium]